MSSYVYGIRFGEYVKIGFTRNPAVRLRQLKSRNKGTLLVPEGLSEDDCEPLFAVLGDLLTENLLHTLFAPERAIGEWYHHRGALRDWAAQIREAGYVMPFREPAARIEPADDEPDELRPAVAF
jgi:hypothetical protein